LQGRSGLTRSQARQLERAASWRVGHRRPRCATTEHSLGSSVGRNHGQCERSISIWKRRKADSFAI
jgi:hypothetical protein